MPLPEHMPEELGALVEPMAVGYHAVRRGQPVADDRVLEIVRVFDAPRSLVFKAWADPAHTVRWMGPRGYTATHYQQDLRPGGAWRACLRRDEDGKTYLVTPVEKLGIRVADAMNAEVLRSRIERNIADANLIIREYRGTTLDPEQVYADIARALAEDLPDGADDATSVATIPADATGSADWAAREPGVVAGLALAAMVFHYVMGDEVTLVSSAEETAKDVYRVLADADLLRPDDLPPPDHGFTTTGDPEEFRRLAVRFLGVGSRVGPVFTSPPQVVRAGLS